MNSCQMYCLYNCTDSGHTIVRRETSIGVIEISGLRNGVVGLGGMTRNKEV